MMGRPKWSDITGRLKLPKDCFDTPSGWLWDGEWLVQHQIRFALFIYFIIQVEANIEFAFDIYYSNYPTEYKPIESYSKREE